MLKSLGILIFINSLIYLFKLFIYKNIFEYLILLNYFEYYYIIGLFILITLVNISDGFIKFLVEKWIILRIRETFRKIIDNILNKNNNNYNFNQIIIYLNSAEKFTTRIFLEIPNIIIFILFYIFIILNNYGLNFLIILPISSILVCLIIPFTNYFYKYFQNKIDLEIDIKNKLADSINNLDFIKLNNKTDYEIRRINKSFDKLILNKINIRDFNFGLNININNYSDCVLVFSCLFSYPYLADKIINISELIYFIYLTWNLLFYIKNIRELYEYYLRIFHKFQFLIKLLKNKNNHQNNLIIPILGNNPNPDNNNIIFENINFSYDGTNKILNNINFKFENNKINLLLGPNGSGKSTLIKLLLRLYELNQNNSGKIYYKSQDISVMDLYELRRKITFVGVEPSIFNETVIYNIKYGLSADADSKIIELCDLFYSRNWLIENQYKLAGIRGKNLSGGERKKIQLINALCHESDVLIFDEPTNTLDSNSVKWFMEFVTLLKIKYNKTLIIITHDLRLVEFSDLVIDLNKLGDKLNK